MVVHRFFCHFVICIQIQINQLLICIEKLSPLPGFEPQTSQVPSRCAANSAIQACFGLFRKTLVKTETRLLKAEFIFKEQASSGSHCDNFSLLCSLLDVCLLKLIFSKFFQMFVSKFVIQLLLPSVPTLRGY